MGFDITKLSEDELLELNRRVVERLQFIRSAKNLTQLARFSVGMAVEFDTDDGRTISGTVARLNQRTATVVTAAGRPLAPANDHGARHQDTIASCCCADPPPGQVNELSVSIE